MTPADRERAEPLTTHDAHSMDRLTRQRDLTEDEARCLLADHQTAIRHGTATPETEAADWFRNALDEARAVIQRIADLVPYEAPNGIVHDDAQLIADEYLAPSDPVKR